MISKTIRNKIINAIETSDLASNLPSSILLIIINLLETKDINFTSHDGTDLIAFNINGDYLGTIVHCPADDQNLCGFDFDSNGSLYVALYKGFLAKYPLSKNSINLSPYSMSIEPRKKDAIFNSNMHKALKSLNIDDPQSLQSLNPEGVVVIEDDKYKSVFVTSMDPINGVIQFSLDGIIQRVICCNKIYEGWTLKSVPSYFLKSSNSSFLKNNKHLFLISDRKILRFIDIDRGKNGVLGSSLDFIDCLGDGYIGDFTFIEPKQNIIDDKPLLITNLQYGLFQFHQLDMFWMLKQIQINDYVKYFKELNNKNIQEAYGLDIGPNGWIYFADFSNDRIIKMRIIDYDIILNENRIDEKIDHNGIDLKVFVNGIKGPNYTQWYKAKDIGLNFVNFPNDTFKQQTVI